MKQICIRIAAFAMTLCMLLPSAQLGKARAFAVPASAEGQKTVNIPYGEDISAYNPEQDGYYGLLPVQYEKAQDDAGLKTMEKVYMPVLVSEGHLYISDSEMQSVLGLTVKKAGSTLLVSAYERHLALGAGNPEAQFFAGDFADSYISLSIPLSAPPVCVGESVWAPLQDLCILFDLGLHQEAEGEDIFITVYDPDETVIDVLAYLYNNSSACMTAYTSGDMALLSGSSAAAQVAAKMLDGDATAWAAVALSAFGLDEKGYELLLEQLADDLTVDLMCVIPDESVAAAKASVNKISDVLSAIQTEVDLGANAAVDMDLMDAVLEARLSSSSQVNDPHWFSEALDKIDGLTEQKKKLKAMNAGIDGVLTGVTTVFGMLQTAATYASIDEISLGGVSAICANREYLTYSDPIVLEEIEKYAAFMQSGAVNYSLYDYISRNAGSWVLDGLTASCPVFKLMQLATHLIPALAEGIDSTHSFQISVLAIPLQSDVERILKAELKAYPARKADKREFKALSETAYIYLKTCYIARNQAASALGLSGDALAKQQRQMNFLLEKMAILSVNYTITPENTYSKVYRIQEIDDSTLIDHYTKKMILQISGAVLKEGDESPVTDAHCEIVNADGELCGFFDGTPDGWYDKIFVPFYQPAGCIPHKSELVVTAQLRFTSPTVEGEANVQAKAEPGAAVNPVEPAYLGESVGFSMASTMGEIDGTLYCVSTRYIDESEGIQPLPAPAGEGYYVAKFAYYGGKIYYVEKTPGTDDTVGFRLCRCEKDGSSRTVLVESGGIGWSGLYFVIENGYISWKERNASEENLYHTYGIAEGKMMNGGGAIGPLTVLALGGYNGGEVVLVDNKDETWTLYRRLLNHEDEESLSYSLVRLGPNRSPSVPGDTFAYAEYKGMKGYIEGVQSIFAVYNGYAYMTAYENNDGVLYKLNLNDANDLKEIGRHMTAGGGDAFFNY